MGGRAIWKGTLKIGAQKLSVKTYAAIEDAKFASTCYRTPQKLG